MREVRLVLEETVLTCHGPHPYGERLPDRYGSRIHGVRVGFPLPFLARFTGVVWRRDDEGGINRERAAERDGRILIPAVCRCGAISEYEVVQVNDG